MKCYYDFHIHSCLSPCGDNDMTPNNIVNMARLCGLDIIAVADHNSLMNVRAVMDVANKKGSPLVLAAMELTTQEDIHVLVLFRNIQSGEQFQKIVLKDRMLVKNKSNIFGQQLVMDEEDNVICEEENLLITATNFTIQNVLSLAAQLQAIAIPAHVDRQSNGIIGVLGGISDEMGICTVEVSPSCSEQLLSELRAKKYNIVHNSDAHFLQDINEKGDNFLQLKSLCIDEIFDKLSAKIV